VALSTNETVYQDAAIPLFSKNLTRNAGKENKRTIR
jgi:hypothetical protein